MESSCYGNKLNNYLVFLSSYVNAHDLAGLYMCWAAEGPEECRKLIAKLMVLNMVCQPVLPTHINKCLNFLFVFPLKWIFRFRFRGKSETILIYQMCMFYFSLFYLLIIWNVMCTWFLSQSEHVQFPRSVLCVNAISIPLLPLLSLWEILSAYLLFAL